MEATRPALAEPGYVHVPPVQCIEAQSMGLPQAAPASQSGAHAALWQVPSAQTWVAQSELAPHGLPVPHFAGIEAHGGGWQVPLVHWREAQSMLPPHAWPFAQSGAHDGGWHLPETQRRERQSPSAPQAAMSAHEGEQAGAWHVPVTH